MQIASRYDADITASNLTLETQAVDAKSILQLMQLQARQGHRLRLCATGLDAQDAIDALRKLFDARFYDIPGATS